MKFAGGVKWYRGSAERLESVIIIPRLLVVQSDETIIAGPSPPLYISAEFRRWHDLIVIVFE